MKQINKSKFVLLLTLLIVMIVSFFYMKIEMSYAVFLILSCILLFMIIDLIKGTIWQYSKGKLNKVYLNKTNIEKIMVNVPIAALTEVEL